MLNDGFFRRVSCWALLGFASAGAVASNLAVQAPSSAISPIANDAHISQESFQALSRLLRKTSFTELAPDQLSSVTFGSFSGSSEAVLETLHFTAMDAASASDENALASEQAAADAVPLTLKTLVAVQTPTGFIATASLPGAADGAYVVVHGDGTVSALSPAGDVLWHHPGRTFMKQTGRLPPGELNTPPVVLMGADPIDPFVTAGEHPFAVGDLTGDGADDVAVAHWFRAGTGIAGTAMSMVSVLDGRSGAFVWSRLYPGFVTNVLVTRNVLVVANETGNHKGPLSIGIGQDGTVSNLDAWRFTPSPYGADASPAWTLSTQTQWAQWLALEPMGTDRFAAAWTDTPVGTPDAAHGHVLLVSADTGAVSWTVDTAGYPRILRYDAARNQVVALEEDDPVGSSQMGYSLAGRAIADGSTTTTVVRQNAVALSFQVSEVAWVVGDLAMTPNVGDCPTPETCTQTGTRFVSGNVTAFDPATGSSRWTQTLGGPGSGGLAQPYALLLDQGSNRVIAASFLDASTLSPSDTALDALDGATGQTVWSRQDTNLLFPLFLSPYTVNGRSLVMGAPSRPALYGALVAAGINSTTAQPIASTTPYQVVRTFDSGTGVQAGATPLLGEVYAMAGVDINADGIMDYVVGGESGAVFALDGQRINDENPAILWRATVAGPVRRIELGDVDGDGKKDLVVAATRGVDVIKAATGKLIYELAYPNDLVWTLSLDDLDGDGRTDIVVPTTTLAAYKGSNGSALWSYTPAAPLTAYFSTAAITPAHQVAAEYLIQNVPGNFPGNQTALLLDGKTGAMLWSHTQVSPNATVNLWRGAVVADGIPGVAGTAAAFTWVENPSGTAAIPRVDVYDAGSGALAYSSNSLNTGSNHATLPVPGVGIEALNMVGPSLLVTPTGTQENLKNYLATDLAWGSFGAFGKHLVVASWPYQVPVLTQSGLTDQGSRSTTWHGAGFPSGGLDVQDLDGDGQDEIFVHPFDWDGFANVQLAGGAFSFSLDILTHGFAVIGMNELKPLNQVPAAQLVASPASGTAPLLVRFDASASSDPDSGDSIAGYTLDFGDGGSKSPDTKSGTGTPGTFKHVYTTPGTFTATLTVNDSRGGTAVATTTVTVTARNRPRLN